MSSSAGQLALTAEELAGEVEQAVIGGNPQEALPAVLERTKRAALGDGDGDGDEEKVRSVAVARVFCDALVETLNHSAVSEHEKPLIASQYVRAVVQLRDTVPGHVLLTLSKMYPFLFDFVAKTSQESLWESMCDCKRWAVGRWRDVTGTTDLSQDGNGIGEKLALVKFFAQVTITQTILALEKDDRAKVPPQYQIHLGAVPDDHPIITNKQKLETEAKQLLDLMLSYLIEEPMMVSPLFMGLLNCLASVIKFRPQTTNRVLNGVLKFNVDAKFQLDGVSVPHYKLAKRFVERCYKNFANFGIKNNLIKQSTQYYNKLAKIAQVLHGIGEETKSKGVLAFDHESAQNKISDEQRARCVEQRRKLAKRRQLQRQQEKEAETKQRLTRLQAYTRAKSSTVFLNTSAVALNSSYSAVYSLMNSEHSEQDLSQLPRDVLVKLTTEAMYRADTKRLITALSVVASRYTQLLNKSSGNDVTAEGGNKKRKNESADDDTADTTAPRSKIIKTEPSRDISDTEDAVDDVKETVPYDTPITFTPKPMDDEAKLKVTEKIISKIIKVRDSEDAPVLVLQQQKLETESPLEQVRLLHWNNAESWYHILIRLATRGTRSSRPISDKIRAELLQWLLQDFNGKAAVMVEWMNEEWFADKLFAETEPRYEEWSLRLLDELIPFLENKHRRIFIRLMSELPQLSEKHIERIKPILLDPGRSALGLQTLKFLIMFRNPVKTMIKDLLNQVMEEDATLKEQCRALLEKYYK
ncbi:RNA-processing protein PTA1 KNAG_0D05040 [Huiozyma naganishii CBS 8797]|uniref:Symplekin/Pta1 N-terminal domain-containing protein n=1 Tax=Huiozyma naganishii (strain ATCC MYA-139 / BCRC 22969 / CBS 8797 / KCTC 17520 / NBRC 10181 / NCYC 3082 / Yp74L-3) TaxID=1071383 RepID=J7RL59_HUIN7|nr:hypothetical protein KNAG_0D05040 [Kazachstania naganishii CBS 8797]CCK70243.1 hypothetical protein KNAG_0D05040 [Kazachstania naganishii CBS 8797]